MTTNRENVPDIWSIEDELFFREVTNVFAPRLLWGASVLLGSNDDSGGLDCVDSRPPSPVEQSVRRPLAT